MDARCGSSAPLDAISTVSSSNTARPEHSQCVVCMDALTDVVLKPCQHAHCCLQCFRRSKLRTCPVCRTVVTSFVMLSTGVQFPFNLPASSPSSHPVITSNRISPATSSTPSTSNVRNNNVINRSSIGSLSQGRRNALVGFHPASYRRSRRDDYVPGSILTRPTTPSSSSSRPILVQTQYYPRTDSRRSNRDLHRHVRTANTSSIASTTTSPTSPNSGVLSSNSRPRSSQLPAQEHSIQRNATNSHRLNHFSQTNFCAPHFFSEPDTSTPSATVPPPLPQQPIESIILIGQNRSTIVPLARKLIAAFPPPKNDVAASRLRSSIFINGDAIRLVLIDRTPFSMGEELAERVNRHSPNLVLLCADYSDVTSFESVVRLDMAILDYLHFPCLWVLVRTGVVSRKKNGRNGANIVDDADIRVAKNFISKNRHCLIVSVDGSRSYGNVKKLGSFIYRSLKSPGSESSSSGGLYQQTPLSNSLLCLFSNFTITRRREQQPRPRNSLGQGWSRNLAT